MSAADYLDDALDSGCGGSATCACLAPCRDARVLRWLVDNLGAEVLLAMVDATEGGTLGQRLWRTQARQRIEELA